MSVERLELSTNGLKGRCSTVELHARDGTFYHAALEASTDFQAEVEGNATGMRQKRAKSRDHSDQKIF